MKNVLEKYKELIDDSQELIRLKSLPSEDRGDDLGSSIMPTFKRNDVSLMLLAQRTSPDGFVETYCLTDEERKRIKAIRKLMEENPEYIDSFINISSNNKSLSRNKKTF